MRIKNGFVLRQVCGENVIVGEGLGAINFGKMLALNDEYEVSQDEAKADVKSIVDEWTAVGVIE